MTDDAPSVYRPYADRIRIVELAPEYLDEPRPGYRFEAPQHVGRTLKDPDLAELSAAVYFAVDGFRKQDTGRRGAPLAVARPDEAAFSRFCGPIIY